MSENIEAVVENPQQAQDNNPVEQHAAHAQESDNSLDSALGEMFKNTNEDKSNEKQAPASKDKVENQAPDAQGQKDVQPVDKGEAKPETRKSVELPDPETIGEAPSKKNSAKPSERWEDMRKNYKEAYSRITDSQRQIEDLKKQIAERSEGSNKEVEKYKQELTELSKYRAMVDIQADPEFMQKFDAPLQAGEKSIREMIASMGVSAEIAGQVNPLDAKMMDTIINHVAEHKDKFTARKLERKVEDYMNLHDKRTETLAEHKENYHKTLEDKKRQAMSMGAESEGRMLKHFDTLAKTVSEDKSPRFPFLAKREVPSGANAAQIELIDQHNQMVDMATKKVGEVMKMSGPEQRAEIAVAAVSSQYLSAQNEGLRKEVQSLKDEIKKLSAVTEETPKTKVGRNDKGQYQKENGEAMSTEEALQAHFGRS